jgi:hypothetical protein
MTEPTKPKKTLSPEQLQKLSVAREKALAVRQNNAKNKALEKELVVAEKEKHFLEVKEKLAKVKDPASAVMGERLGEKLKPKKEPPKVVIEPDSDPESEPEVIIRKKKSKGKKKIVIVEDSDTDDEQQQVIFVKRKKDNPLKPIQQPEPVPQQVFKQQPPIAQQNDDPYQRHYESMFNPPRRY